MDEVAVPETSVTTAICSSCGRPCGTFSFHIGQGKPSKPGALAPSIVVCSTGCKDRYTAKLKRVL